LPPFSRFSSMFDVPVNQNFGTSSTFMMVGGSRPIFVA
jgi:hypothetical protein